MNRKYLSTCLLICVGTLVANGAQAHSDKHDKYKSTIPTTHDHASKPDSGRFKDKSGSDTITLHGLNVDFVLDGGAASLFGKPSVSGDTLYFSPTGFKSQSLNGAGYSLVSNTLDVTLVAHDALFFGSLGLTEKGDYLLLGSGGSVGVTGQIRALDPSSPFNDLTSSIITTDPLGMYGMPSHNWQAGALLDLTSLGVTTSMHMTLENILLASTSSPGSLAFIEKKFVGLTAYMDDSVSPSAVPEPATYLSMLSGLTLLSLAGFRRKK